MRRLLLRGLVLLLALTMTLPALAETPLLEVHHMMIGCADGCLIRVGDLTLLIDGGEANPRRPEHRVMDYLQAVGVDHIDAVIITHWHLDHCMNLNEVLEAYGDETTVVYSPAPQVPSEIDNGSVTVPIGPLAAGTHQQAFIGDVLEMGGMTITFIGPERLLQGGRCNQDSLNFVLQYGSRKFLFSGDFVQSNSVNTLYTELCRNVDVLKFPHHGIEPFEIGKKALRVIRPQWVLVPGVVNPYKVWNFADNVGVKFPRENVLTNAHGHVVILTDGAERFEVLTQVNPESFAPGS